MQSKKGQELKKASLPQEYETYVFDLYGTLVDIRTDEGAPQVWEKMSLFYGYYGAGYEAEELRLTYESIVREEEAILREKLQAQLQDERQASCPEIEITQVFRELFSRKGIQAGEELVVHTGQLFRVLTTEHIRLYPGTTGMLATLRGQGKKIYLLSNAQRIFTAYEMELLDISKYFDGILISSDYGTRKPDERFFRALIDKYGIDVQKSLFVGNDSRSDIAGARQVGMDTFYVKSNISPQGDMAENATFFVKEFTQWT